MTNVGRLESYGAIYNRDGFLSRVPILSASEAMEHRERLESAEKVFGKLHYVSKVHTIFADAAKLSTDPRALDVVKQLIGPDILLFDVTYIIKDAQSRSHVSWHQDLTYWGFSGEEQVSMWLALSPATEQSGCMRMAPGSHLAGRRNHQDTEDENNVLHRGQSVHGVAEETAALCPLKPGEASFHHGWTLHASMPNASEDRRIGLNVQYITPSMKQLVNPHETALLVRGRDAHHNYAEDVLATSDFDPGTLARHAELDKMRKATWESATQTV